MPYPPLDRPERIPELFALAWNRRDPDGIADLFDEDAEFVNVTGLWWHDRAAIRKAHAYGLEKIFADSTLEVVETRVKALGADVSVVYAKMRLGRGVCVAPPTAPSRLLGEPRPQSRRHQRSERAPCPQAGKAQPPTVL